MRPKPASPREIRLLFGLSGGFLPLALRRGGAKTSHSIELAEYSTGADCSRRLAVTCFSIRMGSCLLDPVRHALTSYFVDCLRQHFLLTPYRSDYSKHIIDWIRP